MNDPLNPILAFCWNSRRKCYELHYHDGTVKDVKFYGKKRPEPEPAAV